MKKIHLLLLGMLFLWLPQTVLSQSGVCNGGGCTGGSSWGAAQTTTSSTFVAAVAGTYGGEYNTYNVTAGQQYEWSLCPGDAGVVNPTGDAQLTLRTTAGVILCYADDICGASPKILWTSNISGQVQVLVNQYYCTTNAFSYIVAWRCVSCGGGGGFNPCTGITNIGAACTPTSAVIAAGTGAYNPPSATCNYPTPGQEKIYTFTPTVSGLHQIAQSAAPSYVDYFFKPVSGGCNGTGWTCIQDLFGASTSGTATFVLTAGTQYYILLDPESTIGGTVTFSINQPAPAAPSATTATPSTLSCGPAPVNLNATSAGNTIQWYNAASGGTLLGTSASGANFSITPAATTTYYAGALATCGGASAARTAVTVTVSSGPAAPSAATATPATINCPGTAVNLTDRKSVV